MGFIRITEIYIESFGKLSNIRLKPNNGMVLINGRNEAGKSTICAFIKFMLYGVKSRANAVIDNEKIKFAPWDGTEISGSMSLESDNGDIYVISRKGTPSSSLHFTDNNGNKIETSLKPGEYFFGVDENTFSKSAFVGQNEISADRFSGLSQMLKNLIFDNEGEASVDDVRKKLIAERNSLMSNARHSGEIAELKKQKSSLESDLMKFSGMHKELLESEFSLSESKKVYAANEEKKKQITAEIENLKCIEAKKLLEKLKVIVKNVNDKKALYDDALASASTNGLIPTAEYIETADATYYAVCSCGGGLKAACEALEDARNELQNHSASNKKCLSLNVVLSKRGEVLNEKRAFEIMDKTSYLTQKAAKFDFASKLFAFLIVTLPLFFVLRAAKNKALDKISEICADYGCSDVNELHVVLSSYGSVVKLNETLVSRLNNAIREYEKMSLSYKNACNRMAEIGMKMGQELDATGDNFSTEYRVFRKALTEKCLYIEKKRSEYDEAMRERIAFLSVNDVDKLERFSRHITNPSPEKDSETLERELRYVERANELLNDKISELERKAGILTGAVPNPSSIATELENVESLLKEKIANHKALVIAIEALDEACSDIRNSCVPLLADKAGELFAEVSQGKYPCIKIGTSDGEISVPAGVSGASESEYKDFGYLSAGTYDALCVCVRVAFARCFLKETPPIIFDDAFTKLDDHRLKSMINLLCGISGERQIFILSCHEREKNFLDSRAQIIDFPDTSE